jgi:hypothetical protein
MAGQQHHQLFGWKLLDMLVKLGMKDVYKRFKIIDSGFTYDMFVQFDHYDLDACQRWVTKREVNPDRHVFLFMSHELIFVPMNMENVHWVFFVICPENQETIFIDSLYDPRSHYHIIIDHNIVHFIQDYQKIKSLPQDKWGWHTKPITVKRLVNQDDCGVCMSLGMYCLIFGLDYRTIPPHLFHNQAPLFMFYTVMGCHFSADEDDNINSMYLDEERGMVTNVEAISPPVQYTDDCNRYERQQPLQNKKIYPPWSEHS